MKPRALTAGDLCTGLAFYAASSAVVLLAAWFGHRFVSPSRPDEAAADYPRALCRLDGLWYLSIVRDGYAYDPEGQSNVAFFPAYPLAIRAVTLTGLRPEWAAVAVSHGFLAAAFVLLAAYVRIRNEPREGDPPAAGPPPDRSLVLLAFAVLPTTFFMRMAYSEAMFTFWCVLILYGYGRGWHPFWLALVAGVAAGTRGPGLALALVVVASLWRRAETWGAFVRGALLLGPVAVWGLAAFVAYQGYALGEPLAFSRTQQYWSTRLERSLPDGVRAALLLEPVWRTYDPGARQHWERWDPVNRTPFSLHAADAGYFLAAVVAVAWGWRRGWLNPAEVLLGAGLLLVPYLTKAYPAGMISFGRFASVAVPIYLVYARWLGRLPAGWVGLVAAVGALWLVAYAALFGGGYWVV